MFYGKLDNGKSYYWEGNTVGSLPDGEGKLVILKSNGKVSKEKKMNLTYGTDPSKYPYPSIQTGKYLGETKTKKGLDIPNGFGVLIQDDETVSYGTFKAGQLNGSNIVVCKNKQIVYVGDYSNGVRSGHGEEYKSGELYYSGSWKNDMKEGKGIMYDNGRVYYEGDWKEDLPKGIAKQDDKWTKIK